MWLWGVNHVVFPPGALHHPQTPPLLLIHQSVRGDVASQGLWKDDVSKSKTSLPILVGVVCVALGVGDGASKLGHILFPSGSFVFSATKHLLLTQSDQGSNEIKKKSINCSDVEFGH